MEHVEEQKEQTVYKTMRTVLIYVLLAAFLINVLLAALGFFIYNYFFHAIRTPHIFTEQYTVSRLCKTELSQATTLGNNGWMEIKNRAEHVLCDGSKYGFILTRKEK